jgi:flagellar hook assembly protein FlgD
VSEMGFNIATPLMSNKKKGGGEYSAYKQMMDQDLGKNIDFLFQVMVKKAQSMMPGKENDNDLSTTVLQVASTIQQAKTNSSMDELNKINQAAYNLAATNIQGHLVEHKSDSFTFNGDNQQISTILPTDIKEAEMIILDHNMQIIKSFKLNPEKGRKSINWDGINKLNEKVDRGKYSVQVRAIDHKNQLKNVEIYVDSLVDGIEFGKQGLPQLLSDNSKIAEIYRIKKSKNNINYNV